jgi:hypothetical protein
MTAPTANTKDEILRAAMEALQRELGPSGMIQFLQQLRPGKGDYTAERHKILDRISLSDIPALLAELRSSGRLSSVEDGQGL